MLASLLGSQAMVPLVEVDDAAVAIEVARALVNNGLPAFEVALRSSPVRAFVTVTVAPGTIAPFWSFTVPEIFPVSV